MEIGKKEWFGIFAGAFIAVSSLLIFWDRPGIFYFLLVVSLIVMVIPFVVSLLFIQSKEKEMEQKFLAFTALECIL